MLVKLTSKQVCLSLKNETSFRSYQATLGGAQSQCYAKELLAENSQDKCKIHRANTGKNRSKPYQNHTICWKCDGFEMVFSEKPSLFIKTI